MTVAPVTPQESSLIDLLGQGIDQLINVDVRPLGPTHGCVPHLHQAALLVQGGGPLTLKAAQLLRDRVKPGDVVLIATGCSNPVNLPNGETDGPPGAAVLARMIRVGLDAHPIILVEPESAEAMAATCRAIGLGPRYDLELARVAPWSVTIHTSFPTNPEEAKEIAPRLLEQWRPAALIATEKLGPNRLGIVHGATGLPYREIDRAAVEYLFLAAQGQIPTIGVGDNGNEIGMGLIEEAVRQYKPYGDVCACECGNGLATTIATDVLVTAAISNYGCYGIAACLAALLGDPTLVHTGGEELEMLQAMQRHNVADGNTGAFTPTLDGTPTSVQESMVKIMRWMVYRTLDVNRAWKQG